MLRAEQIRSDGELVDRIATEKRDLEVAKAIYIGRIESRFEDDRGTIVRPLKAYKGSLPTSLRSLVWVPASLCGGDISDGEGWRGQPGELVVVFEGLDQSMWRPNGIDSLLATSIRSPELLRWLEQFGNIVRTDETEDSE